MTINSLLLLFTSSFMALFPVLNPVGNAFIVNGYFAGLDRSRKLTMVRKLIVNYLAIGVGTLLIGHLFLILFGLAIPVIQLGGGLLIAKTAINLLSDPGTPPADSQEADNKDLENSRIENLDRKIFYPITFPISVDPGSISIIFTLMASANVKGSLLDTSINYVVLAVVIAAMAGLLYLLLTQGDKIIAKLGPSGNLVINKLVAFFTFCIGIQISVEGISSIFHISAL